MIERLNGIHETVNYKEDTQIRLYLNDAPEDYPHHWHTPFELIMPTDNSYRVVCGNESFCLREGDILLICPGIIHRLFAPDSGKRIIFQSCLSRISLKELDLLLAQLTPAVLITPEDYPQIYDRIHHRLLDIQEEYFSPHQYTETLIYAYFLEILVQIGRSPAVLNRKNFPSKDSRQKEYVEKFLFICNYISEHFAENLTLEDMASMAGFSKYHFTRLFRQYADTTFYKYLNQQRIAHAKSLLLDPTLPVIDVALASGFSSLSAFLRMFKQISGCTPTEFRKMND